LTKKMMEDHEIVTLYLSRDERAIAETERKYKHYLLAVAANILCDPLDREECLNDTYLDVWNAIPPARPHSLRGFLSTVMRRRAIDRYKANSSQKRIPSELTVSLSDLDGILSDETRGADESASHALKECLEDFVRGLSKRRMYVFMSRYYMAHSVREIAENLGCSLSTVEKELTAIKRELDKKLRSEGFL